ncbi:hypothetical protein HY375_00645 [Candidatus Berkelbacteria bacterium]|nr:hypothetical protein [Candidatus Berkelbacteria bacterium]
MDRGERAWGRFLDLLRPQFETLVRGMGKPMDEFMKVWQRFWIEEDEESCVEFVREEFLLQSGLASDQSQSKEPLDLASAIACLGDLMFQRWDRLTQGSSVLDEAEEIVAMEEVRDLDAGFVRTLIEAGEFVDGDESVFTLQPASTAGGEVAALLLQALSPELVEQFRAQACAETQEVGNV